MRFKIQFDAEIDLDAWAQEYGVDAAEAVMQALADLRNPETYFTGPKWDGLLQSHKVSAEMDLFPAVAGTRPVLTGLLEKLGVQTLKQVHQLPKPPRDSTEELLWGQVRRSLRRVDQCEGERLRALVSLASNSQAAQQTATVGHMLGGGLASAARAVEEAEANLFAAANEFHEWFYIWEHAHDTQPLRGNRHSGSPDDKGGQS